MGRVSYWKSRIFDNEDVVRISEKYFGNVFQAGCLKSRERERTHYNGNRINTFVTYGYVFEEFCQNWKTMLKGKL